MKKKFMIILLVATAMFAFAEGKPQTTCPVMKGNAVNPKLYTDVNGYRIYVCCKGCIDVIKADPQKYIEQMKTDGIEPEKTPEKTDATSGASRKWNTKKSG